MRDICVLTLTCRLTKDPELRHTPSGMAVCKMRVAYSTSKKDDSGNWADKTNYLDVTVWGVQGEKCAEYLAKGRQVGVTGRLEWREWNADDGTKRQAYELVADVVLFLGSKDGSGSGGSGGGSDVGGSAGEEFVPAGGVDDDIPF